MALGAAFFWAGAALAVAGAGFFSADGAALACGADFGLDGGLAWAAAGLASSGTYAAVPNPTSSSGFSAFSSSGFSAVTRVTGTEEVSVCLLYTSPSPRD